MRYSGNSKRGIRRSRRLADYRIVAHSDSPASPLRPTMTRTQFLQLMLAGGAGALLAPYAPAQAPPAVQTSAPGPQPAAYDFWFTRLMYESGDWNVDQRMPANLLDALIQYTTLRVDPKERVLPL